MWFQDALGFCLIVFLGCYVFLFGTLVVFVWKCLDVFLGHFLSFVWMWMLCQRSSEQCWSQFDDVLSAFFCSHSLMYLI